MFLRFSTLASSNGFRKLSDLTGIIFQRNAQKELKSQAIKQVLAKELYSVQNSHSVTLADCTLGPDQSQGSITSRGQILKWDLQFKSVDAQLAPFEAVPKLLHRPPFSKNHCLTWKQDLMARGTISTHEETFEISEAVAAIGQWNGKRHLQSWISGRCSSFVNEQGEELPFLFEGLTARSRLFGGIPGPKFSTFYFFYRGKNYSFNQTWDSLRSKSKSDLETWNFRVDHGNLSFRGKTSSKTKDYAGLVLEDTDGSLIYCASSALSDIEIHIYRNGKLESALYGKGTAQIESASRELNPYVSHLS